jgi:hypothetical protein
VAAYRAAGPVAGAAGGCPVRSVALQDGVGCRRVGGAAVVRLKQACLWIRQLSRQQAEPLAPDAVAAAVLPLEGHTHAVPQHATGRRHSPAPRRLGRRSVVHRCAHALEQAAAGGGERQGSLAPARPGHRQALQQALAAGQAGNLRCGMEAGGGLSGGCALA